MSWKQARGSCACGAVSAASGFLLLFLLPTPLCTVGAAPPRVAQFPSVSPQSCGDQLPGLRDPQPAVCRAPAWVPRCRDPLIHPGATGLLLPL